MLLFTCSTCQQMLFFDNFQCVRCGHRVAFLPDVLDFDACLPEPDGVLFKSPRHPDRSYRPCANAEVCNWMLPADVDGSLCRSCRLTRTIPDQPENQQRWARMEAAKRRLVYTLLALHLPLVDRLVDENEGLAFDFLLNTPEQHVLTGHASGVITINAAEADDDAREQARVSLNESYRTLLGHFRHESGHYYFDRLVGNGPHLPEFRRLFGDERADYGEALKVHHDNGPPPDWLERGYISAYASSHPWEDWAETWAHYLHMVDTLETARAFGLNVDRLAAQAEGTGFAKLLEEWVPLTLALNSLNRSMGLQDLYPFVLSQPAIDKLSFVHELCQAEGTRQTA